MDVMATIRGLQRRVLDVSEAGHPRGEWLLCLFESDPPTHAAPLRAACLLRRDSMARLPGGLPPV